MRRESVDGSAQTSQPVNSRTPDPSAILYPTRQLLHTRPVSFSAPSDSCTRPPFGSSRTRFRWQQSAADCRAIVRKRADSLSHCGNMSNRMILLSFGCDETGRGETAALDKSGRARQNRRAQNENAAPLFRSAALGVGDYERRGKTATLRLCELITYNPDRPCPIPIKIPETTCPPVPELLAQPEHSNRNAMIAANTRDTFMADYSFQILRIKVEVAIFKTSIPLRLDLPLE